MKITYIQENFTTKYLNLMMINEVDFVRNAVLYGSETPLVAGFKLAWEDVERLERIILRKIIGPTRNQNGVYVFRLNREFYELYSSINDEIRK